MSKVEVDKDKLLQICENFIKDQRIHCAETIYQTDRVIENSYVFIQEICDLVGYMPLDDEDK
jgi:hypothetical protein